MSLIDSKSLLAKLMATEDLTVEQRKVMTASFDVKNRILTIPILDNNISAQLYDLFMGHEVGHALYTPLEGMIKAKKEKINKDVLNIVEDSRIERKVKYKYPGLKNSFIKAYGELMERDFFEVLGKDLNKLNFIDRINLHCKVGAILAISFNEEERELLNAVESTETYDEVIEVSKRIIKFMEEQEEEIPQQRTSTGNEQSAPSQDAEKDENSDGESQEQYQQADGESSGDSEEQDDSKEEETNEQKKGSSGPIGADKTEKDTIRSSTDEAYRRNESKLFSTDKTSYDYADLPKFNMNYIFDHKEMYKLYQQEGYTVDSEYFIKYRREANKVVSYLVKEFEMRKNADQLKRASVAKTGELDMKRVYSYNFSDDIFKRMSVVPDGKSHGLIMYVDWSGSMVNHIGATIKQLLNLAMFCKKVCIPFEVYSFIEQTVDEKMHKQDWKSGTIKMNPFGLLNILSSRMTAKEFVTAGGVLMNVAGLGSNYRAGMGPHWFRMGGTPLNEAIISAMEVVPHFQQKNKLQIVNTVFLTDGEGHFLNNIMDANGYYKNTRSEKTTHIIIRDPKTKHSEKFSTDWTQRNEQTNALVNLLRRRTNSHVIGFFVASTSEFRNRITEFFPDSKGKSDELERIKSDFVKDKYMVVTQAGFDEYYVLRSTGLDTDDEKELEVRDNMTTRGIVSAFSKYTGTRTNNRVILNRFIGLIS